MHKASKDKLPGPIAGCHGYSQLGLDSLLSRTQRKRGRPPKHGRGSTVTIPRPQPTYQEACDGYVAYSKDRPCPDELCMFHSSEHFHCTHPNCYHVTNRLEVLSMHVKDFHGFIELLDGFQFFDRNYNCRRMHCPHSVVARHYHCVWARCDYSFIRDSTMRIHARKCRYHLDRAQQANNAPDTAKTATESSEEAPAAEGVGLVEDSEHLSRSTQNLNSLDLVSQLGTLGQFLRASPITSQAANLESLVDKVSPNSKVAQDQPPPEHDVLEPPAKVPKPAHQQGSSNRPSAGQSQAAVLDLSKTCNNVPESTANARASETPSDSTDMQQLTNLRQQLQGLQQITQKLATILRMFGLLTGTMLTQVNSPDQFVHRNIEQLQAVTMLAMQNFAKGLLAHSKALLPVDADPAKCPQTQSSFPSSAHSDTAQQTSLPSENQGIPSIPVFPTASKRVSTQSTPNLSFSDSTQEQARKYLNTIRSTPPELITTTAFQEGGPARMPAGSRAVKAFVPMRKRRVVYPPASSQSPALGVNPVIASLYRGLKNRPTVPNSPSYFVNCGRPFCKLKKKQHYHCVKCSQGFSDQTKLSNHMFRHGWALSHKFPAVNTANVPSFTDRNSYRVSKPVVAMTGTTPVVSVANDNLMSKELPEPNGPDELDKSTALGLNPTVLNNMMASVHGLRSDKDGAAADD